MKKNYTQLLVLLLTVLFAACGGGEKEIEPTKLGTPAPTLTITGADVSVVWPKVEAAAGYTYELTENGASCDQGTLTAPNYRFTMQSKWTYSFRVKATADKSGMYLDSEWSAPVTAKMNQLSMPTVKLDEASVTNNSATLSWTKVTNAASYRYQLLKDGTVQREAGVSDTTLKLTDLAENTTYKVKVKAVAAAGYIDSGYSREVSFTTYQMVQLATPQNLSGTTKATLLTISWGAVDKAAAYQYELYRNADSSPVKSGEVSATSVSFDDMESGNYRFRVKAIGKADDPYTLPSEYSGYCTFQYEKTDVDIVIPASEMDGVIRAFPGAEGGGMYTTGGRGGKVIHVTNLNDSGTGSLRAALEESGARTIVFDVAGTIQLKSQLKISKGDVTIAGQTAPGDGICLRDNTLYVGANNVIIRFIRFRMGDETKQENDAIWGRYQQDIIIDHCSMSWSTDECGSFYANKNFTLQWCLLGESLRNSVHDKGAHGYGGIWGGKNASFHHNMLTSHSSRNPRFCHPQVYGNYLSTHRGNVDYRNNVVYNWGDNSSYGGESGAFNMVGNYYKPGPASEDRKYFLAADAYYEKDGTVWSKAYPKLYLEGNVHTQHSDITSNNQQGVNFTDGSSYDYYNKFESALLPIKKDDATSCYTSTHTAEDAYARILDCVGASLKRDAIDTRLVDDARNGKATYTNGGNGSSNGIIDTQSAVGGWPALSATSEEISRATTDTDGDHIPDYYEEQLGLDKTKNDASNKNLDPQGLYTNFEIYLHYLVQDITKAQAAGSTYKKLE